MSDSLIRPRPRRQCAILFGVGLVFIVIYVITVSSPSTILFRSFASFNSSSSSAPSVSLHREYDVWPPFAVQLINHNWFTKTCIVKGEFTIAGIPDVLASWVTAENPDCKNLYKKFTAIYTVEKRVGSVKIPETFQSQVKAWLGNIDELYQELFHQDIIHIINMYTRETTVFNPLRDKRPVTKPKESEEDYLSRITKESALNCDFCKYKNFTAEHDFGRVETKLSFSASNIFKLDRLHAVITIKDHDPVNWSYEQYMDMMHTTVVWLKKAFTYEPSALYPAIIWDLLPKSGSSQLHPHNQVFLSPNRYQGMVETWRRAGQDYFSDLHSNYFSDLITLYSALGLAVQFKSAVALASLSRPNPDATVNNMEQKQNNKGNPIAFICLVLTPRKDNEVVIIAPEADDDFFQLIYYVLRAFMDDLKKYSFSLGGGFPPMESSAQAGRLPAFVRIITRGVMTEIRTDISALELFTATNVNIDPYKVVKVIKDSVQKRAPRP